jgi:hypothetical protein
MLGGQAVSREIACIVLAGSFLSEVGSNLGRDVTSIREGIPKEDQGEERLL